MIKDKCYSLVARHEDDVMEFLAKIDLVDGIKKIQCIFRKYFFIRLKKEKNNTLYSYKNARVDNVLFRKAYKDIKNGLIILIKMRY